MVGDDYRRVCLSPAACRESGGNTVSALIGRGRVEGSLASAALPATSGLLAVAGPATPPQFQSPRDLGLSCGGKGRSGPHRRWEGIRLFAVDCLARSAIHRSFSRLTRPHAHGLQTAAFRFTFMSVVRCQCLKQNN